MLEAAKESAVSECAMEYEFTLKYTLSDEESDAGALVERLAEAGCDDALVGMGRKGRIALNFIREAAFAKEAIISALTDVKRVIPHARLLEVTPDFVGLSWGVRQNRSG
jgi:hypothetical protein